MLFPNLLDSEHLKSRVGSYLSTLSIQPVLSDSEGVTFAQTCSNISLVLDEPPCPLAPSWGLGGRGNYCKCEKGRIFSRNSLLSISVSPFSSVKPGNAEVGVVMIVAPRQAPDGGPEVCSTRLWRTLSPRPELRLSVLFSMRHVSLWGWCCCELCQEDGPGSVKYKVCAPFRLSKTCIFGGCLGKIIFLGCLGRVIYSNQRKVCWEVKRGRGDLSPNEGRKEGMTRRKA